MKNSADTFIECLKKVGVQAEKRENGIAFDSEAFKNVKTFTMPRIVCMNRDMMMSRYHTTDI
jgi:hypothetical protein